MRLPTHVDTTSARRGGPYHRDGAAREARASGTVPSADAPSYAEGANNFWPARRAAKVARYLEGFDRDLIVAAAPMSPRQSDKLSEREFRPLKTELLHGALLSRGEFLRGS
jgi:hypothetical protein